MIEMSCGRCREEIEKLEARAERAEADRDRLADWKACILVAASYSGNMKLSKAIERADDAARDGEGGE